MTTRPDEHRLLAVFAHPDDETISAGTLLALAVRSGIDVSVVTCTRGERGKVIPPELAGLREDPQALGQHREAELSAALAELGVHRHLFLDQVPGLVARRPARFGDSGMAWVGPGVAGPAPDADDDAFTAVDVDVAARLLAVVIRHVCPTAVLTEEPGGGYGHPDHVHAHRVTMRAVELAAEPQPATDAEDPLAGLAPWRVPTVLWAAQDEAHVRAALTELDDTVSRHAPRHTPDGTVLTVPPASSPLPGLVVPASEIAASFDVRPVAERVLAALRQHRSQVQAVAPIDGARLVGQLALSNALLLPILDRAHLRAAPGSDPVAFAAALAAGGPDEDGARGVGSGGAGTGSGTGQAGAPGAAPRVDETAASASASEPRAAGPGAMPGPATAPVTDPGGADQDAPAGSVLGLTPAPVTAPAAESPDQRRGVLARLTARGGAVGVLVAVLAGLVMGALGTVVHRYALEDWPVGVVVALVGVLAAAVTARALAGGGGLLVAAIAVVVVTQTMTFMRPGGDVLVTDELVSYAWLFGAPVMCFLVVLLPRRWFADRPRKGAML